MILSWEKFNEELKVKGLKKKINGPKDPDGRNLFEEIHLKLKKGGWKLKDVIKEITKRLKIKGNIKAFKHGVWGITFLSDDKTIKLTSDRNEAAMVSMIIKKSKTMDLSHIIKYDNIYELVIPGVKKKYYIILMEKITPLNSKQCDSDILDFAGRYLYGAFSEVMGDIESPGAPTRFAGNNKVDDAVKVVISKLKTGYPKDQWTKYIKYAIDMGEVVKNYNSIGLENNDIHEGNLGINSEGRLISFDPSGTVNKKAMKIPIQSMKI